MRLVQVAIPAGKREAALATLDDEGVDYVVSMHEPAALVSQGEDHWAIRAREE